MYSFALTTSAQYRQAYLCIDRIMYYLRRPQHAPGTYPWRSQNLDHFFMQEICSYSIFGIPRGMLQKSVGIFLGMGLVLFSISLWAFEDGESVEFEYGNATKSNYHILTSLVYVS